MKIVIVGELSQFSYDNLRSHTTSRRFYITDRVIVVDVVYPWHVISFVLLHKAPRGRLMNNIRVSVKVQKNVISTIPSLSLVAFSCVLSSKLSDFEIDSG